MTTATQTLPPGSDTLTPKFQEFMSFLEKDDGASTGGSVRKGGADTAGGGAGALARSAPARLPGYDKQKYGYAHRHAPELADFSSVNDSGKRCYRLNLERGFDIHCEQSPLEYGDYMAPWSKEVQPPTVGPTEYCPPRHLGGEETAWRELMRWSHGEEPAGVEMDAGDEGASNYAAGIGGSGWRKLTPSEARAVRRLGERDAGGELAFRNYDLSHVVLNAAGLAAHDAAATRAAGGAPQAAPQRVRTIFSVDSHASAEERKNKKSPEETAEATGRLFRRSAITLQDAADKEDKARSEKAEREAEAAQADKEQKKLAKGKSRRGLGLSKSFRKLTKSMKGGSSKSKSSRSLAPAKAAPGRCSVQASQIDKARDMVDGLGDGGGLVLAPGDGQTAGTVSKDAPKKLNVSLYVVGEYDVLNDLVNNGAPRLADSRESKDLALLLQNEPCPSPDRWVRRTGWGKCNPSSEYARRPPADFDWERYDDKLWLKTDDPNKAAAA